MTALGDRLRQQELARIAEKQAVSDRRKEAERAQFIADGAKITSYLTKAKVDAEDAVEQNRAPRGCVVKGYNNPFIFRGAGGDRFPNDQLHPHYKAYLPFRNWAEENGVKFDFVYEHDGVGLESWYRVIVKPI